MGIIRQMPEALANQIAAGEVVERPASVVKELVENAIDAGARQVIVELIEAGIQKIKVTDDGEGMSAQDLPMAFMAHATSKIYSTDDLFTIQSLGFRGEALASIGSVSKVRVESKQEADEVGAFIEIEGSQLMKEGQAQARKGTSVEVNSLFYNTPARLKHLKSLKTELSHSLRFIQNIAMAYPMIRFELIHNGQQVFLSHGNDNLQQVIAKVYQPMIAREMAAIHHTSVDFELSGYISKPTLTRTSRQYLHWFINGRSVKSYALDEVLVKAYGRQLMIGRYPLAVINIKLDPRLVDVNVHPTKQTVRLSKEEELSQLIREAVAQTLASVNPIPTASDKDMFKRHVQESNTRPVQLTLSSQEQLTSEVKDELKRALIGGQPSNHSTSTLTPADHGLVDESTGQLSDSVDGERETPATSDDESNKAYDVVDQANLGDADHTKLAEDAGFYRTSETDRSLDEGEGNSAYNLDFASLRYVGQIHGTYLIAESEYGFFLIDQHAAQERIRYEWLMNETIDVTVQQHLLFPIILHFTLAQMASIQELEDKFKALGIYLELMGPTTYKLESYPDWLKAEEVESVVNDLVDILSKQPSITVQQLKEETLIMQSCRGAIKANHYLSDVQAKALIQDLDGLEDPYHCPHGRPVFVEFNQTSLEKLFKRIQDHHERGVLR